MARLMQRSLLLLVAASCAAALEHGTISSSSASCQQEYEGILADYNQTILEGSYNCTDVIEQSFASQDGTGCFRYDIMISCFSLQQSQWDSFVQRCDTIFSAAPNCVEQGTTWADCSRPQASTDVYAVGMNEDGSKFQVTRFHHDSGYVDNAGAGWQSRVYTAVDTDRRRRLQQVEDNEGGGGGSGLDAGCFPDFYSYADWEDWIQGSYQEPVFGGNQINPIGTIFWILQFLGIFAMAFL